MYEFIDLPVGERGCGLRKEAGVYAELPTSKYGRPVEDCTFDPPQIINPTDFGLTRVNMVLTEIGGVYHVLDWVGTQGYPNPTDDIEEVRRMGMSARLELSTEQYRLLTPGISKILRVHEFAGLAQISGFPNDQHKQRISMQSTGLEVPPYTWNFCPQHNPDHDLNPLLPCVGWLWSDVSKLDYPFWKEENEVIYGYRTIPAGQYFAMNVNSNDISYAPAIYAAFPIQQIAVVRDPNGGHEKKLQKLEGCQIPFRVVDQ